MQKLPVEDAIAAAKKASKYLARRFPRYADDLHALALLGVAEWLLKAAEHPNPEALLHFYVRRRMRNFLRKERRYSQVLSAYATEKVAWADPNCEPIFRHIDDYGWPIVLSTVAKLLVMGCTFREISTRLQTTKHKVAEYVAELQRRVTCSAST